MNRAVKNLASNAAETLEEGTISSLIAMSLEGKKSQLKEDVIPFEARPQEYKLSTPPVFFHEDGDFSIYATLGRLTYLSLEGRLEKGHQHLILQLWTLKMRMLSKPQISRKNESRNVC